MPRGPYLDLCLRAAGAMDAAAAVRGLGDLRCRDNLLHDALLADGITTVARHLQGPMPPTEQLGAAGVRGEELTIPTPRPAAAL
eukprot:3650528-Prymnesium_polylepis.1